MPNLYLLSPHRYHLVFVLDAWDCVVTCYFIDTAHNVIAYIENISKILKPGGYWINLGKLKGTVERPIRHSIAKGVGRKSKAPLQAVFVLSLSQMHV